MSSNDPTFPHFAFPESLLFGDVLAYSGNGFFSRLIKRKTWSQASHVELFVDIYGGKQPVWGSRDGKGVDFYELRTMGLLAVLRPRVTVRPHYLLPYLQASVGQPYDWRGLLTFENLDGKRSTEDAQFCSEAVTRALRQDTGFRAFSDETDAEEISPGDFLRSPAFVHVYRKE